ncbi:MAG TPA: hydroxymethylbilane synthase [Planctomycetes bacterium]|nr:hydroxymethylbilane synthase [Planctomycetota bacterium]
MTKVLTVATRGGKLAIAQTGLVCSLLKKIHPGLKIKIKKITTRGDRDRQTTLWTLKDTGFFTSKLEDALLASDADFAVHSFKDLPTHHRDGLTIAAVCDRQFAEDCLLAADLVTSIDQLPHGAKVGTSSLRRAAQLKHLRADLVPTPVRGNVLTRIKRLGEGKYDAIILARAGIERLGLADKISFCFDPKKFIPAPAQGALAVQTRTDDRATNELIAAIDGEKARTITFAERRILTTMQCGCHAPVGAFAKIVGDNIEITAFISALDGRNFIRRRITGPAEQADTLADQIANDLLASGGKNILASLEE